jgi:hypothetical protein
MIVLIVRFSWFTRTCSEYTELHRPWIHDQESNKIFSEDFVFGQSLSELELNEDNMEEIISRCRHLQVETIRFTRWRQMDMLEDFIKSQNGSFEAK